MIQDGEKIKYIFLRKPNPFNENVISFISDFPGEFNLTEYIDYDTMYEKGFLEPLNLFSMSLVGRQKTNTTGGLLL